MRLPNALSQQTLFMVLFDVLRGKNGSGIWIHGMPLDGKDRDDLSKGCVVMDNDAIKILDSEINAQSTMTIIGESKVPKLSKETVATLLSEVYKWQRAWKVNDINTYLNYYSNDFKRADGSGKAHFSTTKKQIFSRKETKTIVFENINIAPYPTMDNRKLFKIAYEQTYKSPSFASKGEKELYVELIGNKMSILAEK
jgi:murein L,D-transpeptidase YafK